MNFKKYYIPVFLCIYLILLLGLYGLGIYYIINKNQSNVESLNVISSDFIESKEEILNKEEITINVDIKGSVKNPGVYTLPKGSIVNDFINAAGGFTNVSYVKNINLSKRASDQMVIYVYTKSEYKELTEPINIPVKNECMCPSYEISTCLDQGSSIIEFNESVNNNEEIQTNEQSKLININTASASELTLLNGIGESKAQSIIDYRNTNGLFNTIEDIKLVSGISETIYAKIKDYIKV